MNNDSLLVSISKELAAIKQTADIDTGISFREVSIFVGGLLASYLVYLWNKNKEFRDKRGSIAGEIYLLIHDFKEAYIRHTFKSIVNNSSGMIIVRLTENYGGIDSESQLSEIKMYQDKWDKEFKDLMKEEEEIKSIRRMLSKHFGMYRFYLTDSTREEFDKTLEVFTNIKPIQYNYDLPTKLAIERETFRLIGIYRGDLNIKFKKEVDAIISFLEANIN